MQEALDLICEIYTHAAKVAGIVGSNAPLELSKLRWRPLFAKLLGGRERPS